MHFRPQRDHQLTQIHHLQVFDLGHLRQVEVCGHQRATSVRRKLQQSVVRSLAVVTRAVDHQPPPVGFPQILQQLQATSALCSLFDVGGVRQLLHLIDHRFGNDHLPFQQAAGEHAADPAIDDHAGVQNLGCGGGQHPIGHQQGLCAGGIEQAQQRAAVNFRQVASQNSEKDVAHHRQKGLEQNNSP